MSMRVECPSCSTTLKVPDEMVGRNVRCPRCQNAFVASESQASQGTTSGPAPSSPPRQRPAQQQDRDRPGDQFDREDDPFPSRGPSSARRRPRDDDYDDRDDYRSIRSTPTNGLALAGMIVGICGIVFAFIPCCGLTFLGMFLGVVGAILSGVGLSQVSSKGTGKGQAIAGLVVSLLAVIIPPVMLLLLWLFLGGISLFGIMNAPKGRPGATRPSITRPSAQGTLQIQFAPDQKDLNNLQVTVDGKRQPRPFGGKLKVKVSPGLHTVKIEHRGKEVFSRQVNVKPSMLGTTTLKVDPLTLPGP